MKQMFRVSLLALASALALSACGLAEKAELNAAKGRWAAKRPASYQYTLSWGCFCSPASLGPTRITVTDGVISAVVDAQTGEPVDAGVRNAKTIDELFDIIDQAFARNAYKLDATYDPQDGHPVSANIDYVQQAVDEELGFTVSDLHPVQ